MRYTKLTLLVLAAAVFFAAAALDSVAGLNPQDLGLPAVTVSGYAGGTALDNNFMSVMCVACHNRTPYGTGAGATGTHFVYNDANPTNSGGGFTGNYSAFGVRDNAAYFHFGAWSTPAIGGNSIYSKYGDATNRVSTFSGPAGQVGYEMATPNRSLANMANDEIICESCHNIVRNVAGGNNLVELQGSDSGANFLDSGTATLCVGCHGFMYQFNAANAVNNNYDNTWNGIGESLSNGYRRNNSREYKDDGSPHLINHHVCTGDDRDVNIAAQYLNWSPTSALDTTQAHVPIDTTERPITGYTLKSSWGTGFTKATTATNFSCLACHAAGHGGHSSVGASILRGTAAGPAANSIERMSSGTRGWKDQDAAASAGAATWCQNCHKN